MTLYPKQGEKSNASFAKLFLTLAARTDISQTAKLLLSIIGNLSTKTGYCYAGDDALAASVGVSRRQVQRAICELENTRLVFITGATSRRHIRPAYAENGVSDQEALTPGMPALAPETAQAGPNLCHLGHETYAVNDAIIEESESYSEKKKKEKIAASPPSDSNSLMSEGEEKKKEEKKKRDLALKTARMGHGWQIKAATAAYGRGAVIVELEARYAEASDRKDPNLALMRAVIDELRAGQDQGGA